MYRIFFSTLVLLFSVQWAIASPIKIEGKIIGLGSTKEIFLYPDMSFGEFDKQVIPVFQQGIFSVELDISYPQMVSLGINGRRLVLYISPGNNLYIDADLMMYPQGVNFGGDAGPDNYMLQQYFEVEPPMREADMQYYRIFGHQFPYSTQIAGYMGLYHPDVFRKKVEKKQARMKALYEDPQFAKATPDFRRFLQSEVDGFLQYSLLSYTLLFAKREKIELNYFGLESLSNGDVNSGYYRNYLLLNNMYTSSLSDGNNPRAQTCYRLAQNLEQGFSLQYLLSEIIINAVRKGDEETLMLFEEYLNEYPSSPFLRKIDKVIYKGNALFVGAMAPDFFLETEDGGKISLSQFKGKIVYIDFWASWCGPCLENLDKLEKAKRNNPHNDIVFITISVDASKQVWKSTLKTRGYSGVHLYAGKGSDVVKNFKVKGVPSQFIVKKNGLFAPTPEDTNAENLLQLLNRLNGGGE